MDLALNNLGRLICHQIRNRSPFLCISPLHFTAYFFVFFLNLLLFPLSLFLSFPSTLTLSSLFFHSHSLDLGLTYSFHSSFLSFYFSSHSSAAPFLSTFPSRFFISSHSFFPFSPLSLFPFTLTLLISPLLSILSFFPFPFPPTFPPPLFSLPFLPAFLFPLTLFFLSLHSHSFLLLSLSPILSILPFFLFTFPPTLPLPFFSLPFLPAFLFPLTLSFLSLHSHSPQFFPFFLSFLLLFLPLFHFPFSLYLSFPLFSYSFPLFFCTICVYFLSSFLNRYFAS